MCEYNFNLRLIILGLLTLLLEACGGGGYGSGGGMSSGCGGAYGGPCSSSSSSSSAASLAVNFSAEQLFPAPTTSATATASFTLNQTSGAASGDVTLSGVTATAVTINDAFAGNSGPVIVTLTASGSNPDLWNIPASTTLTAPQLADLVAGKLYVLVTSAGNPNGELRAQIVPAGVAVVIALLGGDRELPAVTTSATGMAAATVKGNVAAINVNTSINTALGVELHYSSVSSTANADDTLLVALNADNSVPGHWLNENVTLTNTDASNFNSSRWFVNVFTSAHAGGEIAGRFAVNPPTLATLQANIFGAICAACHTGTGAVLPGSQNLTTQSNTFTNVVNVDSLELSSLKRVRPYDPDNSYVVRKIEGNGIAPSTVRMPASGNYLSQAQINQVRAWVAAGAQNN